MDIVVLLGLLAIGYLTEYVVAVYATAIFLDPDDLTRAFPDPNGYQRHLVSALNHDPRALTQILALYRSFVLITATALSLAILKLAFDPNPIPWFAYPLTLLLVWGMHLFCVEYLPRKTSRRFLAGTVPSHFWIVAVVHMLFAPLLRLYRRVLQSVSADQNVTEDQKDDLVERAIENLADQAGISEPLIEEDEKEMIGGIFELDQTVVREIMVPRIDIDALPITTTISEIRQAVNQSGHSRFPIYDGTIDKIIGLLYVKDLFSKLGNGEESIQIHQFLRTPLVVPETKVIGELLREFRLKKVHLAIVADEYGGTAGLITLEDILEQIVGEIQDEHDIEEGAFQRQTDGSVLIDAALLVEDLQQEVGTDFDADPEFDTVGGLIYALVGSVPAEGRTVRWHSLEFRVEKVSGQRISRIRLLANGLPVTRS